MSVSQGPLEAMEFPVPQGELAEGHSRAWEGAKRVLDFTVALVALALTLPLALAVSLLIVLDSPGSVLFKQKRVGKGGRLFTLYKFRSMYAGVDDRFHRDAFRKFVAGRADHQEDGRPAFKPSEDQRVTRVGRVLRASSLDELAQLINVLKGDMSIVGPRPAIPYEMEFYRPEHYKRFSVRPGMTGLWQVEGRSQVTFQEMMDIDIRYVESSSPWLDFSIVLRTVPVVLLRRGGH